jgi:hypothetical protein
MQRTSQIPTPPFYRGNSKSQISNSKHAQDIGKRNYQNGFGHWILEFVCDLLARRLSGGVLVI